jgi:uncharacterized coiled-coil protein SlyX
MNRTGATMPTEVDPDATDRMPAPFPRRAAGAAQSADVEDTGNLPRPDESELIVAALEAQLAEQAAELARLEKELEKANSKPRRGRRPAGKGARLAERVDQLERENSDLAARNSQLAAQLAEQQPAIAGLENELNASRRSGQSLQRQLAALGAELEERGRALAAAQADLAASAARLAALEAQRAEDAQRSAATPAAETDKAQTHTRMRVVPPVVPVRMQRYLVRLDPGHEAFYELVSSVTNIGRTPDNDVQVSESFISRCHAIIKLGPDSAVVEDAGSSNGVFVNGRRVIRQLLRDGDTVVLGKARFRFEARPQEG